MLGSGANKYMVLICYEVWRYMWTYMWIYLYICYECNLIQYRSFSIYMCFFLCSEVLHWGFVVWESTVNVNSLRPGDAYMRQQTNHHWFRWWLATWPAPSHYLNQCWIIVNWTLGHKLQWKSQSKLTHFHSRKSILKMTSRKWWPFWLGLKV